MAPTAASASTGLDAPHQLYAEGVTPDYTLVLKDSSGVHLARLHVVKSTLSLWSPVLKGAMECSHWTELTLQVSSPDEPTAWKVALCLMHPLDPTSGHTPASLITLATVKPLLVLADKYNIQGLLPHCKDVLLNPTFKFVVCPQGAQQSEQLDAFEWLKVAEGIPGFGAVVSRCIQQIVLSTTNNYGRAPRSTDKSRYTGHDRLLSALSELRPETSARVSASMASCLATMAEMQAANSGYHLTATADNELVWGYSWTH